MPAVEITTTTMPKTPPPKEGLVFGQTLTDHMLVVEWTATEGWYPAKIIPYQPLAIDPAASVLQYGFQAFEGMKAYKDRHGDARLFRPDKNVQRLNNSASKMALPSMPTEELVELLKQFAKLEKRFIPMGRGYSLYLRPNIIGTHSNLKVGPPQSATLYVIASPVGTHYATEPRPLALQTQPAQGEAVTFTSMAQDMLKGKPGRPQCLSFREQVSPKTGKTEDFIADVPMMNIFVVFLLEDGRKELATPKLDGNILEGLVRECVVDLARESLDPAEWTVSERDISMQEVEEAEAESRLLEVFGTNTATIVTPIQEIQHRGKTIACRVLDHRHGSDVGEIMRAWLDAIQYGDEPQHPWSVLCD